MALVPTDYQTYTKAEVRQEVLRAFGGHVEALTGTPTTTQLVVANMIGRFGDNNRVARWGLYLPAQSNNAFARARVSTWTDTTGTAVPDITLGEQPAAGETVEFTPRGDPGPDAINEAINQVMRRHRHTVWSTIPTRDGVRRYDLGALDWIEHQDQAVAVYRRPSPNLLTNPSFETWGGGSAAAPSAWSLNGSGASVARASGRLDGFAATITQSGAVSYLEQDLTPLLEDLRGTYGTAAFTAPLTVTLGAWAKTSSASVGRVTIDDGPSASNASVLHTGGGTQEFISVSHTLSTTAYRLLARVEVITTSTTNVTWDDAFCVEGSSLDTEDIEHGEQRYRLFPVDADVTLEGARPSLRLQSPLPRGNQLVIATEQPYFTLATETDTTDMPLEAAAALTMRILLERLDAGKAQDRYNAMRFIWLPRARYWAKELAPEAAPIDATPQVVSMGVH